MAYTPPQFNIPVDVWSTGHIPDDDDPDFENVSAQFYIYSRVSADVHPCELELYHPITQIRLPVSVAVLWVSAQIFEVPSESGRYYRAKLKERIHLGFPNEYLVAYVVQCNGLGEPFQRDIEGSVPCDHEPADRTATGAVDFEMDMTAEGEAILIDSSSVRHASGGPLLIEFPITGSGEAFNTGPP